MTVLQLQMMRRLLLQINHALTELIALVESELRVRGALRERATEHRSDRTSV